MAALVGALFLSVMINASCSSGRGEHGKAISLVLGLALGPDLALAGVMRAHASASRFLSAPQGHRIVSDAIYG